MDRLDLKEGQTYVCTKTERSWWTEGKEYTVVLNSNGIPVLVDDGDAKWPANALSVFNIEFKLKKENKMSKLVFKEGQTYVCTKSSEEYWTEGKEYEVTLTTYGIPVLTDNNGNNWSTTALNLDNNQFKLKENTRMRIVTSYKCIKSYDESRFTVGEIYPLYEGEINYLVANNNVKWYENEYYTLQRNYGVEFDEIKDTFDLNRLTTAQLKEYVELLEDKENSERLLNEFIERMTK